MRIKRKLIKNGEYLLLRIMLKVREETKEKKKTKLKKKKTEPNTPEWLQINFI